MSRLHLRAMAVLAVFAIAYCLAVSSHGAEPRATFLYFWGVGCPHCAKATPYVEKMKQAYRDVRFESYEVRKSVEGRRRFAKEVKRLHIANPGVPTFVCGDRYVAGWQDGETERCVRKLIEQCRGSSKQR